MYVSAISALKDKPPGTFIVRDSNSFPGAYGLALKVATPPPNIQNKSGKWWHHQKLTVIFKFSMRKHKLKIRLISKCVHINIYINIFLYI